MSVPAARPSVHPLQPVLILLGSSMLWGLTWLPLKYFAGFGLAGITVTLVAHGSVGVLACTWLLRHADRAKRSLGGLLVLACAGGLANLAFASAIVNGNVVRVMVLFYLLPVWGVLGGWLVLGERVDGFRKLAVAAALAGAFLILGGPSIVSTPPSLTDVLAVVSGMALGLNNVWFRKLRHVPDLDKVSAMFAGCLLWAVPLTLLGVQPVPEAVPPLVWLELAGFGLVWLLLATVGTQYGVGHMEAGRSSVLIIVELLTAVASAALLNGSRLSDAEWLGGSMIVAAALAEALRPAPSA